MIGANLSRAVWHKSSHSGGGGESSGCVEVAAVPAAWRKSSHSGGGGEGAGCVEVASVAAGLRHVVAVRDSKDPEGPVLCLAAAEWAAFTHSIKRGGLSRSR